eukprot:TRINITY_DN8965_c1_g7_i1.p1 TRINITY_DN8965_c1_g7~~TRINITY_DN8965_c1_g7_i1.p1  ORF type:complete len:429 (+),score=74.85 TRINITY_DN8965_c1_g7_i1:59-1288(+)
MTETVRFKVRNITIKVPKESVWVSGKGAAYLRGKGHITWCEDDRRGDDCGLKYAEGVGREGCSFGHITDETEKARALEIVKKDAPEEIEPKKPEKPSILDEIDENPAGPFSFEKQLTIVVTTSPTQSNPEVTLIDAVLSTFKVVEGLDQCRLVVVCDGCDIANETTSKEKLGFKRGVVTSSSHGAYEEYKENLKKILPENSVLVELTARNGFGWAVRTAISQHVRTPYTMVIQHDRYFEKAFPLKEVLLTMGAAPSIYKVVYMMNSSLKNHMERIRTRAPSVDWADPVLQPVRVSPTLGLTPCLAWLDSTHIARTSHLVKFVFGMRGRAAESGVPIRRGDFPEDRLNQAQIKSLKEEGPSCHKRYGTWIITSSKNQVRHLSGRNFRETGSSGARARLLLGLEDSSEDED